MFIMSSNGLATESDAQAAIAPEIVSSSRFFGRKSVSPTFLQMTYFFAYMESLDTKVLGHKMVNFLPVLDMKQ